MVEEIERAAARGDELLDGLSQPRQLLFLSLRSLYREYKTGALTKDQAHLEKLRILKVYENAEINWNIYQETAQMRNRLSRYFVEIEKGGCDKCRLAIKIFDGRSK